MAVQSGGSGAVPTPGEFLSVANAQNLAFYKKNFARAITLLIMALLVILALGASLVFTVNQAIHGKREYFAIDTKTGRLTPMPPLDRPNVSNGALLSIVNECVMRANTYNYVEFRGQFERMRDCFTEDGYGQFADAVNRSGSVKIAREGRLLVSANTTGAPVITKQGERMGVYSWEVQVPLLVTFQGGQAGKNVISSKQVVTVLMQQVPVWQNERGVGIASYLAEDS